MAKKRKGPRAASSSIAPDGFGFRSQLANTAGYTFGGRRNMYRTLGYKRVLLPSDYRSRYKRNAVANRLVKALPKATWRGGATVVEDQDPEVDTAFEVEFADLAKRLNLWNVLQRADVLAGIGRFAIVLIGAPGELNTELTSASPDDIKYLMPFAEEDATIQRYDTDLNSPRFGLPMFYQVKRQQMTTASTENSATISKLVHWSRVIHIADGLLDDNIFGEPRLECVWNLLDDLDKVTGGGSEAFWRRADQGMHFDLDKDLNVKEDAKKALRTQIHEYEHDMRRFLLTRGVTVETLGSDVANFDKPADAIMAQIAAGSGIPQRILMGSEQAKLASTTDRSNWDDRVADRRVEFAGPCVVNQFVDRMVTLKVVPEPKQYEVEWPLMKVLDDSQRADIATKWAGLNKPGLPIVVSDDEIRERVLDLPTKEEAGIQDITPPVAQPGAPRAAASQEGWSYRHVHVAADRFRTNTAKGRHPRVRKGPSCATGVQPEDSPSGQA